MVYKRKVKTKSKRRSKICAYRMNETNPKTYRYLLKKEGMPSRASPSLYAWVSLKYLLGVPWASPSLSSCLSSFSSHRDLLDIRTLHPHKTSTESSVRSVSIIKQITTKYCCKTIHILFLHCSYYNITFPWLNPLIEIDISSKQTKNASKTESILNRTVCSNLNIHHTSGTPKILK